MRYQSPPETALDRETGIGVTAEYKLETRRTGSLVA
jgi:hypothetical protein